MRRKIVIVAGPTAVGKTEAAIRLANHFGGEIISADSMQIYKYMDIGSAKPTPEEQARAEHHLVDVIDPARPFSVAEYQPMAKSAIEDVFSRGKLPIISGGTGLYVNSLIYDMDFSSPPGDQAYRRELEELAKNEGSEVLHKMLAEKDPPAAERIHPNNEKKIIRALEILHEGQDRVKEFSESFQPTKDYDVILIGLERDRAELYDRINRRVDVLMEAGLVDEVTRLLDMGLLEAHISMKGIGYKEIIGHLHGDYDLSTAVDLVKKNTRHYAKRQLTWFKRYDEMKWFRFSEDISAERNLEPVFAYVQEELSRE
ncbi:MAG: tRNA (adenosine(37)-N6)-dimethylallyltransferase MiaA [Firmicutes bacterium]|nr:tRNA (adenosine(37)-N6)-dimethylallyltransferase MiaA [Bacillota bacterium]